MGQHFWVLQRCVLTAAFFVMTTACVLEGTRCRLDKSRHFLDCKFGELTQVPTVMFSADIWGIDLSFNNITEVRNHAFSATLDLQTLDLSNNNLTTFFPEAFQGLGNLLTLNLSHNPLSINTEVLPAKLFEPLVGLKLIRIQECSRPDNWTSMDTSFSRLRNLTSLFLSFSREFVFGVGFETLTELTRISTKKAKSFVSRYGRCPWFALKNTTFVSLRNIAAKELEIVQCYLSVIERGAFDPLTWLEVLDISDNEFLSLGTVLRSLNGLQDNNMRTINISTLSTLLVQRPVKLDDSDFIYMSKICVQSIDLSRNYIYFDHPAKNPIRFRLDCLENLNMSYHTIDFWPWKLMKYLSSSSVLKHLDLSRRRSKASNGRLSTHSSLSSTGYGYTELSIPPNLMWLSLNGFKTDILVNSDLTFTLSPHLWYLGAASIDLDICITVLGSGIKNVTHLVVSGAKCEEIEPECFHKLRKLTVLILSTCRNKNGKLGSSPAHFKNLVDLEEIDISNIDASFLHPELFERNLKLRKINLANNKIQHLPSSVWHLTKLEKLDLSLNDITFFSSEEIKQLETWMLHTDREHRFRLLLSGNPLQCSCDTILFVRWLFQRKANLDKVEEYKCLLPNGTRVSLQNFKEQLSDFEVKCVSHTYLIVSVVSVMTSIVLLLLFTGIYRYRLNLRYWLYSKLMPPETMFVDHEYIYDAFVAYTSDEYEWVIRQLRPKLELGDDPVRLCVHDRDFIPGKPIHENIVDKMKESRKILLIISLDFLNSRYGPLEIEYAGMKCLEEGRDDTILCVLMEDIPVRRMPRALRNLWHKITFLKWSDDPEEEVFFWRNLKAAVSQPEK